MAARTYYEILDISHEASEAEIRRAYRRAAQKHHPDQNADSRKSAKRIRQLNAARETLLDPELRKIYDAKLRRRGLIPDERTSDETARPNQPPQEHQEGHGFANQTETKQGGFYSRSYRSNTTQKTEPGGQAKPRPPQKNSTETGIPSAKFLIILTLLPLGSLAGVGAALLILWSSFDQDPLGLFPNDDSSAVAKSENATPSVQSKSNQSKTNQSKTTPQRPIQGSIAAPPPPKTSKNTNQPATPPSQSSKLPAPPFEVSDQLKSPITENNKGGQDTPSGIDSNSISGQWWEADSKAAIPVRTRVIVARPGEEVEIIRLKNSIAEHVIVTGKCNKLTVNGTGCFVTVESMKSGTVSVGGFDHALQIFGTVDQLSASGFRHRFAIERYLDLRISGIDHEFYYVDHPTSATHSKDAFAKFQKVASLPPRQETSTLAFLERTLGGSLAQLKFPNPPQISTLTVGTPIHSDRDSVWSKVPPELDGLQVTQWKCLRGHAEVNVTSPGFVIMATSPRWGGGGKKGNWENQLTTQQELLNDGWVQLTTIEEETANPEKPSRWPVFAKEFQGGEQLRLRTEKYLAPRFFFPAANLTESSPSN